MSNPVGDRSGFDRVKAHLKSLPKAPTSEEAAKAAKGGGGGAADPRSAGTLGRVEAPATRYREFNEGNIFRISVPNNWRELPGSTSVTFAPTGAYGQANGQNIFTHGVEAGVLRNERHELAEATRDFIQSLGQSNPRLTQRSDSLATTVANRRALQTRLENVSDATGQPEDIQLFTTRMSDGTLFYVITVVPSSDARGYEAAFRQVVRSIRLND